MSKKLCHQILQCLGNAVYFQNTTNTPALPRKTCEISILFALFTKHVRMERRSNHFVYYNFRHAFVPSVFCFCFLFLKFFNCFCRTSCRKIYRHQIFRVGRTTAVDDQSEIGFIDASADVVMTSNFCWF